MGTITINKLIGGAINITTTGGSSSATERWVEPVYTDEWVFSDGQEHTVDLMEGSSGFEFSAGGMIYDTYDENGRTPAQITHGTKEELDKIVRLDITDGLTYQSWSAYRKYTPGHWEDADGNWINGSWGAWSDPTISWFEPANTWMWQSSISVIAGWNGTQHSGLTTQDDWLIWQTEDWGGRNPAAAYRTWKTNKDKNGNAV